MRVCFACHQIKRGEADAEPAMRWQIAPIAITQHWLPKSRFPHSRHDTYKCTSCHDVEKSKKSADIAIPDIKNCRECHGGNVTVQGQSARHLRDLPRIPYRQPESGCAANYSGQQQAQVATESGSHRTAMFTMPRSSH